MTTYDTKDLIGVVQAADMLGVTRQRVHQLIKAKKLMPDVVIDNHSYFNKQNIISLKLQRDINNA